MDDDSPTMREFSYTQTANSYVSRLPCQRLLSFLLASYNVHVCTTFETIKRLLPVSSLMHMADSQKVLAASLLS
jgi:hypothetical protein